MNLQTLLKISRPRFWLYTTGPYFFGVLFAIQSLSDLCSIYIWFYMLYFLLFANFLIYGVNDLFDYKTDKLNPKKKTKEYLLKKTDTSFLKKSLWTIFGLSVVLVFFQPNMLSSILLVFFLFFSLGYSVEPIRFKIRPFLDSFSNILYVLPGFLAYAQLTGELVPWYILVAATCWAASMHLYSAIPDIVYDKRTKIKTTATVLGRHFSFLLCMVLWSICAVLIFHLGLWSLYLLWIYPLIPFLHLVFLHLSEKKVYWYFPYITYIIGAIISIEQLLLLP